MKLTVIHNSVDLTLKMDNLANPVKALNLTDGEIFLGYYKPIKFFYVELSAPTTPANATLTVQYFNGSSFANIEVEDRTFGLNKSGMVVLSDVVQVETTLVSKKMYWLKISTTTPAEIEINGINLVLSNDEDFGLIPNIMDYLPEGATSFIAFHQEARNILIQKIRNSGKYIRGHKDLEPKSVDQFDVLNIDEFRQASKYLALHLIFDFLTKGEDHYAKKAQAFLERAEDSINSRLMTIDFNDNGKNDIGENGPIGSIRIVRE